MKKHFVLICLSLAFLGLAAGTAGAGSSSSASEATKVRALLGYQARLINGSRWAALYRTYTSRVRARCPYRQFVAEMKTMRIVVGGPVSLRNVRIRVAGRRATASYQIIARGQVVSNMTARRPDIFTRLNGRWLDDVDSGSPC